MTEDEAVELIKSKVKDFSDANVTREYDQTECRKYMVSFKYSRGSFCTTGIDRFLGAAVQKALASIPAEYLVDAPKPSVGTRIADAIAMYRDDSTYCEVGSDLELKLRPKLAKAIDDAMADC